MSKPDKHDYKDGWGVVTEDSGLDVRTISPTRTGALVNWLVAACGVMIYESFTDSDIDALWEHYRRDAMVRPVRMTVQ